MLSLGNLNISRDRTESLVRGNAASGSRLGWYQVTLIFFLWSILGLVIEELWMRVSMGVAQSRAGLVWGPFSPLYGTGAVLLTAVLLRLHDLRATAWQIFLASMLLGGVLEQATGWASCRGTTLPATYPARFLSGSRCHSSLRGAALVCYGIG